MAQNTMTRFLIAGAGGRLGATGNHVVRQLLERKLPVRAFVFHADQRSEQLAALGAEVVVGDLRDIETVRRAMRGISRAYLVYPIAEGLLEATTVFAVAAKEAGLEAIVNMSQISARADHLSPAARQHWLAEHVLDWTGIGVTHLRPPFFLEDLLVFARTIRSESRIVLPYGQGRHAPVCGEDLARVIVGVLVDPASHRGKTYVPTGPRSLTISEMAAIFGRVLGKPIEYVDLPVERWAHVLTQLQMPPYLVEHLRRVAEAHQRGEFDAQTDVVRQIGGAAPKHLDAFIAENRAAFSSTNSPRSSPATH
jgi:NAD(P)H dehydrogenase (quinone)